MTKRLPLWLGGVIVLISAPLFLPFFYIIDKSLSVGAKRAFELIWRPRVLELLSNTLTLMVTVTAIAIVLGLVSALILQKYDFVFKKFFTTAMSLPLAIPAFISCFTWISLTFKMSGFFGASIILSLAYFPLAFLPIAATLKRIDYSFYEVSASLGRMPSFTFFRVILPQLKPAIGSALLLIAFHILVEFGAVTILNYETFTTAIFAEYEVNFSNATAALLSGILLIICFVIVLFEMKFSALSSMITSKKGVLKPFPVKKASFATQVFILIFFCAIFILSIGVPFAMLVYWSFIGTSFEFQVGKLFEATIGSLGLSFIGAFFILACAYPLTWALVRYRSRLTILADRLPFVLHALPSIIIALSLVYFTINYASPLYQTFFMLLIAYLMLFLPMAQSTLKTSFEQLNPNIQNVGASLGRGKFFIFKTLIFKMIAPGLGGAFALVFLNLMKELTSTLLLLPHDMSTLSVEVWQSTSDAKYALAAPYAFALVLISGLVVFVLQKHTFK